VDERRSAELERGRESHANASWLAAFDAFSTADQASSLNADDLELLARSAYMLGRDDDYVNALVRAHQAHLASGDTPRGVRCAIWIGHSMLFRGQAAHAGGWFARAQRLLKRVKEDCVEHGYMLIPVWLEQMASGEFEVGLATAIQAEEVGERFGDADLVWLARDEQARALLRLGRAQEGLRLVEEILVATEARELSPFITGILYCNTIDFCRACYELRHVREWTAALNRWCEQQPEMVTHNGLCLVHRAELMQMTGTWEEALAEARRAAERFTQGILNQIALGLAHYRQGEIHRLRGDFTAAEAAYAEASRYGFEPQPGMALLRLAQGNASAAAAAIRRTVSETTEPLTRAGLLAAYVEIMLQIGDSDAAHTAVRELEQIAKRQGNEVLEAMSAQALGALRLTEGDAAAALIALRRAMSVWQNLAASYETARIRMLVASACSALGDDDAASRELNAAHRVFEELGAASDLARMETARPGAVPTGEAHGLTEREVEVLRLVAAGKSNREIAAELFISEHTVARHVQNIFAKLGVSSRTAAGAFAFEHDLV
jgi:DNA-binding NarL/FixJ family response regulator